MKYFLCIIRDGKNYFDDNSKTEFPNVGSIYAAKDDLIPECADENDKWVEITQEDYDKFCENYNSIIKYDGIHCIGTCSECTKCVNKIIKHKKKFVVCENKDNLIEVDPEWYKSCCIIK